MLRAERGLRRSVTTIALCLCVLFAAACGSPTAPGPMSSDSVALAGGSTLVFENAAAIAAQRAKIEQVVRDTLAIVRPLLPVDGVTIIAGVGAANIIPELGIGGRADAQTIWLGFEPSSPAMVGSIDTELLPLLVHELHHTARMRTIGYGSNLLGAMVSEGLADQFAVQVAGGPPPIWSTALDPQQLAEWSARAEDEWFSTTYSHDAWFFGAGGTIPRWAGYSIGFALTGAFLAANPGRTAADLHDEPAASFIPGN